MATAKIVDWDPRRYQEEERKALAILLDAVREDERLRALILNDDGEALKYLRARKNDVDRSLLLMRNHMNHRMRYSLDKLMPTEGPLQTELTSGKFTILDSRNTQLAQLLLFTASKHYPSTDSGITAIQSLVLQLDAALSSEETQKNGVILLVDMGGSGLANLDRKLSQSILALLQEGYPARLKMIYIIDAPWWFRTAMAFILPFLKKKTRDRIWISNRTEILRIFKSNSLPKQLGGDLDHDHLKWLQKCTDHYQIQQAKRAAVVKNSTMSSIDTHLVRDTESNMATSPGMLTSSRDETLPLPPVRSSSTGKKPAPQRSPDRPPKRQHGVVPVEDAITPPVPDKPEIDAPPLPPKDLEIYSDEDHALNITGFEAYFKEKGREGIFRDYAVIRLEKPAGNFDTSRCNR
jgi:tyrosine-protein phosphatase non-receptor type 9